MSLRQENSQTTMTHFFGLLSGPRRVAPPANRRSHFFVIFVALVFFVVAFEGCRSKPEPAAPLVSVTRQVGSWSGRGSKTVGDVNSDTGRLRITWQTANESPAGAGRFKLTLRSGVSGRTIAVVADHNGVGAGTIDTDEGPRTYDFLVESANVDWSFRVEETTGERATPPGAERRRN